MEKTTVTDYLAGLDAPPREIGRTLLPVINSALVTDWLRQAHDLEAK
ncbi:hypothetical protein ACGF7U_11060 [Micromonospora sp. NPDC047670]